MNNRQVFYLMFYSIMSTAVLTLPVILGKNAPRDAWLDAILFLPFALLVAWLTAKLGSKFPSQTIVEYSQRILGKWLGLLCTVILLAWTIHTTSIVYREASEFTDTTLLGSTPFAIIMILVSVPSTYAVYKGLEVIGRMADFLFYIIFFSITLIYALLFPEYRFEELLPILSDGWRNILLGLPALLAYTGETVILLFVFPNFTSPNKTGKTLIGMLLLVSLLGVVTETAHTMVFGVERKMINLPFYHMARLITLGGILERVDTLFVLSSLLAVILKISFYTYICAIGSARLFKTNDHKPFILPLVIIMNLLGLYSFSTVPQMVDFLSNIWPIFSLPVELGIPSLLLLVASLRKIT
ncbi:endospore germination permease [Desulfosporosinus sp. PR]|uniref:GerAB/ArcD/ProY family transporter n=1 Tax=Candidatus Desulfosporosinus nitrosoreducens TaxID=3401928 RepID=UPI0027E95FC7|nr:endospore germination permease [Desulfosporosinus sp. PR]MDQ7092950.1 endospore germination permease [Desulfosporosinus sp. PR]